MGEIESFEDLHCWQACRELKHFVMHKVVSQLSRRELDLLGDNLVRAARSTTRNIAEGFGRFHHADNARFCRISRGSCYEVLDDLITAHDDGLIDDEILAEGRRLVVRAVKVLNGYIRYLRNQDRRSGPGKAKEEHPEYQVHTISRNQTTNNE